MAHFLNDSNYGKLILLIRKLFMVSIIFKHILEQQYIISCIIINQLFNHSSLSSYGYRWWPLSLSWKTVDMRATRWTRDTRLDERKNRDCGDRRKTCTFHQIVMWQLLYVSNALVLIAVPLGGERHSVDGLPWWNQGEGVTKRATEGERGVSEKASDWGEKA